MKVNLQKADFKLGQTVFYTLDHRKDNHLFSGEVTKVGTKFVTVEERYQFYYGSGSLKEYGGHLYLSEQAFLDKVELEIAYQKLHYKFRHFYRYDEEPITIEQARAILKILED